MSNVQATSAPKYGQPVMHKELEHKPSEALDKLVAGPDTSILTSLVRSASQAGGAAIHAVAGAAEGAVALAYNIGDNAAHLKDQAITSLAVAKEYTTETLDSAKHIAIDTASDLSLAASDLSASAQAKIADLSIDAHYAKENLQHAASNISATAVDAAHTLQEKAFELSAVAQEKAVDLTHAAQHTAADLSAVAQEKAADLTLAAQLKASELSAVASDLSLAAQHKAAELSVIAQEKAVELTLAAQHKVDELSAAPSYTWAPSSQRPLPFLSELQSRTLSGFKFVRPFTSRRALPYLFELIEKRPPLLAASPLGFSLRSSPATASSSKGDELFAQEKVDRDLAQGGLKLTMDVVAHLQRIADRTGDALLHDTARKAHSAFARGLSEAPGVHLTRVNSQQANELLNLAIQTQNRELADFARYCQSVADTTQIAVEPTPGKISQEIEKGRELLAQGRVHTGPGYGAAFASVDSKSKRLSANLSSSTSGTSEKLESPTGGKLELSMDVVAHIQRIADRTGDALLHETARKAHSACAKGLQEAPGVHLTFVTPQQANELLNLAIQTQDRELADFARYCQSVAATTQVAVEPVPGKIMQEIEKGRKELQSQGRVHTGPGYGAAFASVANAQGQRKENRKSGTFGLEKSLSTESAAISSPIGTSAQ